VSAEAGRRPSLLLGTLLSSADAAISMASALAVSIVLARALGPQGFGLYSLVMTVTTFTFVIVRSGIAETVRRYVAELDGRGQRALALLVGWRGLRWGLLTSCTAALVLVLAAGPLAAFFRHPELRLYFTLGAASLVPMMAGAVFANVLRGLQRYQDLVRVNLVTSPLWVAASSLVVLGGGGVVGLLLVTIAAETANLALLGWCSQREAGRPRGLDELPASFGARMVRYNLAVAALMVINMVVWQRSELIFLGRFQDAHQVAYYALPFSLTERLIELVPGALLGVILPGLAHAYGAADSERFTALFSEAVRWLAFLTLPICLLGLPLVGAVMGLLYGPEYRPAVPVLQVLLAAMVFGVLGQAASSALLGQESQSWLLKTGAVAVVASIGLDLLLIQRWGAIGAALANGLTQAGWALAAFAPLRKRVLPGVAVAAVKAAATAFPLSLLLALAALRGIPAPVLLLAGGGAGAVYLLALERMRLISVRLLLERLRPPSTLVQEVTS
jgi:O-antigen/teichoic acid export membrane protein